MNDRSGAKFSFPTDPEKWQTAYTADNAYYDAGAISSVASLIGLASSITALLYAIVFLFIQLPVSKDLFSLDAGFAETLKDGPVPESLRKAFQSRGWVLTESAEINTQDAGKEWEIRDENMLFVVHAKGESLNVEGKQNGILFLLRDVSINNFLFSLDPLFAETLDAGQVNEPLSELFRLNGKPLADGAVVVVERPGSEWTLLDENREYLIRYQRETLRIYEKHKGPVIFGALAIIAASVFIVFQWTQNIAHRFSESFLAEFYLPPVDVKAADVVKYRVGSRIKLPMPFSEWFGSISQFKYILVRNGKVLKPDDLPAWLAFNMGGPLVLIVFDGSALYLERGNRFSRVVGPGVSFLERYETIKYAVDLRTKSKTEKISVWTKDGITVKLTICVEYRIGNPQNNSRTPHLLYPYDPEAVKKAIERHALRRSGPDNEPSEVTWEDAAWGQVTSVVPAYIGSRFLDDLLVADRKGGQILSPDAADKIFHTLNEKTNVFGVYVTDFQILSIELPDEVNDHYIKYWEAEKQSLATIMEGKAKAFNIRAHEKVRADAQHDLILAIADGLKKNDGERLTEALLLSLSEVLDHGLSDPYMRSYTAKETLETLEKIQSILDKIKPRGKP